MILDIWIYSTYLLRIQFAFVLSFVKTVWKPCNCKRQDFLQSFSRKCKICILNIYSKLAKRLICEMQFQIAIACKFDNFYHSFSGEWSSRTTEWITNPIVIDRFLRKILKKSFLKFLQVRTILLFTNWSILRLLSSRKFCSKGKQARSSMFSFDGYNFISLTKRTKAYLPGKLKLKSFNLRNISGI